jgi:hypothetical protein
MPGFDIKNNPRNNFIAGGVLDETWREILWLGPGGNRFGCFPVGGRTQMR